MLLSEGKVDPDNVRPGVKWRIESRDCISRDYFSILVWRYRGRRVPD
jgi:hypothetical protein